MNSLLLFGLLVLNTSISAWDAYVAGRIWHECQGLMKLVAWSAVIMSVCGFISVLTCLLGLGALGAHLLNAHGFAILEELTYMMIIVPILGTGLVITIQSWIAAWKQRDFASVGIAAYNTYAQISNAASAIENMGGFFDDIISFFGKPDDEDDEAQGAIVLLIVAIAAFLSFGLTYFFWRVGIKNSLSLAETTG